jgi:butyrate kinase
LLILAINPGGGSTKIGVYRNLKPVFEETIRHSPQELARFGNVLDQYELRKEAVVAALQTAELTGDGGRKTGADRRSPVLGLRSFDAIVARGGTLKPLAGGIYRITDKVIDDIRAGKVQTMHPSLLGPLIAYDLAESLGIPAYFVDPESTDEFWPLSRLSGLPEIERRALSHALSVKTVAKRAAQKLGRRYEQCNFVIAHLGTGITIAAHLKGRQVDASNANEDGPMAPQRSGALPAEGLVEVCFKRLEADLDSAKCKVQSAKCKVGYAEEELRLAATRARKAALDRVQRNGGLVAYLGTDDIREVERRIDAGDEKAKLVYDTMIYQIAKEIGAYAAVLRGKIDAIVLTGGMTLSRRLVRQLKGWIEFLVPRQASQSTRTGDRGPETEDRRRTKSARLPSPVPRLIVFPGEEEMKALVSAVLRLNQGLEKEKVYE